jgi:hypothetical protein
MLANNEDGKDEIKRPASFKERPANIHPDGINGNDNGLIFKKQTGPE